MLHLFYPAIPVPIIKHTINYFAQSTLAHGRLNWGQIQSIFRSFDTDGNALLSFEELEAGFRREGLADKWGLYSAEIQRFDFNSDGELSMDEFLMFMSVVDSCAL